MKHKIRFDKISYWRLKELGSKFNLSLSNYVTLGSKIIGMDVLRRKLLIAEKNNELFSPYLIDLNKVRVITIQKIYNSIKAGDLKKRRIDEFLKSIHLHLVLENKETTIVLPFFDRTINDIHDLKWLESKARNWQMIISKMIRSVKTKPVKEKK